MSICMQLCGSCLQDVLSKSWDHLVASHLGHILGHLWDTLARLRHAFGTPSTCLCALRDTATCDPETTNKTRNKFTKCDTVIMAYHSIGIYKHYFIDVSSFILSRCNDLPLLGDGEGAFSGQPGVGPGRVRGNRRRDSSSHKSP